jgi:hypothetical protein
MLERCFDAGLVNLAANHPDVRPYLGPASLGELDFEESVAEEQNWFLMGEHGGFILAWCAPGVYEVHVMVLPEGRGKWAAKARQATIDYAKENGAKMLWARIAPQAKFVSWFARRGGMQPTGEMIYTLGSPYDVYKMEL